jgi:hypothetical protein
MGVDVVQGGFGGLGTLDVVVGITIRYDMWALYLNHLIKHPLSVR